MIRRITAALVGTAAAMTMAGGVALAAPSAGQPVGLAAVSTPLPGDGPHYPGPPHPGPPVHHFLVGHDHPHPGWRYDPHWGWWKGVVSPKACDDGHGHVDWHAHRCQGGRFDDFRVA
jgi:hypothetical protein